MTEASFLKKNIIFSQLSDQAIESVYRAMQTRQLAAGELLFNQGDPGNELIVVKQGKLAIFAPQQGDPKSGQAIRIFQAGDMLGEMALVDKKPRSASARAEENSTILALSDADFQRLIHESDEISLAVMAGLSDRIRYTTDFLSEVRQWVSKIADGNYALAWEEEKRKTRDTTMETLAAEFAHMAAQVKQREDQLKREVAQLRVEIDDTKRRQEVENIMGSEYYRDLKAKVRALRAQNKEESSE